MNLRFPGPNDLILGTYGPLHLLKYRLSPREQEAHATLWGRSGSGKSKLLQSWFIQRLKRGAGVGLIEPHHDLSFDIISWLAQKGYFKDEESFHRLIYIDWGNGRYVPFNVLADAAHPQQTALNVLEAMMRAWPELRDAPLFQTLFLSSMMVLIHNKLPITWLYPLLTNSELRHRLLSGISDHLVHDVFNTFDKLKDQTLAAGSTLRRAFLLSFSPPLRYCLGQQENALNFRKIIDQGKAIIINLGNIGDHQTRKLLGCLLTVAFEQAALSRTDVVDPKQRTPFSLLIDEWPEFCAQEDTLARVLSQARKYRLFMVLASQNVSQVSSERLKGALENCRVNIVFGLGRTSAELQSKQIGQIDPFLIKDEAHYDSQHPQFYPLQEQWESWTQELYWLNPRWAYVQAHNRAPVKIKTLSVKDRRPSHGQLAAVLDRYAQLYQRSEEEVIRSDRDLLDSLNSQTESPAPTGSYSSIWSKPTNGESTPSYATEIVLDNPLGSYYEERG